MLKLSKEKFERLSTLSKIDFSPDDETKFMNDLNYIIGFIDKVKEFQGEYDDKAENKQVSYAELREDIAVVTATPEQLLANTVSDNNCYVIPRVMG